MAAPPMQINVSTVTRRLPRWHVQYERWGQGDMWKRWSSWTINNTVPVKLHCGGPCFCSNILAVKIGKGGRVELAKMKRGHIKISGSSPSGGCYIIYSLVFYTLRHSGSWGCAGTYPSRPYGEGRLHTGQVVSSSHGHIERQLFTY